VFAVLAAGVAGCASYLVLAATLPGFEFFPPESEYVAIAFGCCVFGSSLLLQLWGASLHDKLRSRRAPFKPRALAEKQIPSTEK